MKAIFSLLIACSTLCVAGEKPASAAPLAEKIIGAWTRPKGEDQEVNLRFYADGKAVLWPVANAESEYGTYRVEMKRFQLSNGSSVVIPMLNHTFRHLVAGIHPTYLRIEFIGPDKLKLIRVDSKVIELTRRE